MSVLAQELAELANAHDKGLLDDDEFRLLRQAAFDLSDPQIVSSLASPSASSSSPSSLSSLSTPPPSSLSTPETLLRKRSVASGVATLFRRATTVRSRATPSVEHPHSQPQPPPPASPVPKLGVFPRLQRKASGFFRPVARPPVANVASNNKLVAVDVDVDVFDDHQLTSSGDIRSAIAATDAESRRILAAFSKLETATFHRIQQQQRVRRRQVPPRVTLVLDSEWKRSQPHLPHPPPSPLSYSSSNTATTPRPSPTGLPSFHDALSIHSAASSSHNSFLSQSKSLSSLRSRQFLQHLQQHRASPQPSPSISLSLTRKSSSSSLASHAPSSSKASSFSSRLVPSRARSPSRAKSSSHLALAVLPESSPEVDLPEYVATDPLYAEVADIQRRKKHVMDRCTARLDYLRARLKSAELHEKLLRS